MSKFICWLYVISVPILSIAHGLSGMPTQSILLWLIPFTIIAFIAERYYE